MDNPIPFEARLEDIRAQRRRYRRFQRARGRRLQQRHRRERPARRRSDRRAASSPPAPARCATSATSRPTSRSSSRENCVGCMDCVTQCPDTAILGKVAEPSTLERAPGADSPTRTCARAWPRSGCDHQQVLHRPREEGRRRRQVRHLHRSDQVQGLRRMRGRLRRSRRPEDDPQERREPEVVQDGLRLLQVHAGDAGEVHQREGARRT